MKMDKKMTEKIKLGVYWGAGCGGCDIAILDSNEKILDLVAIADIVLWPLAVDFKYKDIEELPDKSIHITLYNGAIVSSDNEKIAKLLRKKSKFVVAFGTCACFGGIPGLCNLTTTENVFKTVYKDTPTTSNKDFVVPQIETKENGLTLKLPEKYDVVKALNQVIDVDCYVPGCPPAVELVEKVISSVEDFIKTNAFSPKGTVLGSEKALCDECKREREEKKLTRIYRPYEIAPDKERCLLDQGIICMGPATRGGCGARCINANMPCRGCMGPTANVTDQGLAMLNTLASVLGLEGEDKMSDENLKNLIEQITDTVGIFYTFGLPVALINRKQIKGEK